MKSTEISKLNKRWSAITFGCWQIAPSGGWGDMCSPSAADAAVKCALDQGITAFDTAEGYGDGESERRLGKALGTHKDDVIIISKIWPDAELAKESYAKHLDDSLRALQRDYVDVYLIHWPGEYFSNHEKTKRLSDCMLALQESGKAKLVGLSNFHASDLSRFDNTLSDFFINQVPYSMLRREYEGETRSICQQNDISYMAYSPLAQGLLGGRLSEDVLQAPTRRSNPLFKEPLFSQAKTIYGELEAMAERLNCKPMQIALAWVIQQPNILTAIVGSRKVEQIQDLAKAGDLQLSETDLEHLQKLSNAFFERKEVFS